MAVILLGGSVVAAGEAAIRRYLNGTDITISCVGAFSAPQIGACCSGTTTCSIDGVGYVGTCSNLCCNGGGSSACLSNCTQT
jgi:hypothetical protein